MSGTPPDNIVAQVEPPEQVAARYEAGGPHPQVAPFSTPVPDPGLAHTRGLNSPLVPIGGNTTLQPQDHHNSGRNIRVASHVPGHFYMHGASHPYQASPAQQNTAHVSWPGYPYAYHPAYGPPYPGYQTQGYTPHPVPSQGGSSSAQFGVDPARLAVPPSFPITPSSEPMASTPGSGRPPGASLIARRSVLKTSSLQQAQAVQATQPHPQQVPTDAQPALAIQNPQTNTNAQPILAVQASQAAFQQAFAVQGPPAATQPTLTVQTPQVDLSYGLVVQAPHTSQDQVPVAQTTLQQGLAAQTLHATPQHAVAIQGIQPLSREHQIDDEDEDGEEDDGNDQDPSEDDAIGGGRSRRGKGKERFVQKGSGKHHALLEKWNAEACAKGYNPNKKASGTNPWAGHVEGAGLGGEEDRDMFRRNYLLPPFTDQAQNTRTYRRWIIDLMTKAEDISRRTGCLFYMIAQHATAGKPYSWYASPRLRREAPQPFEQFHGLAAQAFVNLLKAEKETKISLVGELKDAKAAQKAVEEELAKTKEELATLKASRDESQTTQFSFVPPTTTLERLQNL